MVSSSLGATTYQGVIEGPRKQKARGCGLESVVFAKCLVEVKSLNGMTAFE